MQRTKVTFIKRVATIMMGTIMAFGIIGCGKSGSKGSGTSVKDNVITINGGELDVESLCDKWAKTEDKVQFDSVAKEFALELAKNNVVLSWSRSRMYEPVDANFYQENGINVEGVRPVCIAYLKTDRFETCQIMSSPDFAAQTYDMVAPNGIALKDGVDKLGDNKAAYEVLNLLSNGDIYKTQKDYYTGFGKSYVSMYLDGELVDISSYEDEFKKELDDIENYQSYGEYRMMIRGCTFLTFHNAFSYYTYDMMPGDDVPAMREILKHDILAGIALEDCLAKLDAGTSKTLMVVRIQNNQIPSNDDRMNGDLLTCVFIRKSNNE